MGNCKDCLHWEHHIDMRNKQWSTCSSVDWVAVDATIDERVAAIYADACDDSGLDAGLKTGPMFGCIQFQQRAA